MVQVSSWLPYARGVMAVAQSVLVRDNDHWVLASLLGTQKFSINICRVICQSRKSKHNTSIIL